MTRELKIQIRDFGPIETVYDDLPELRYGDWCILKSAYGTDYGKAVSNRPAFGGAETQSEYRFLRKASGTDLEKIAQNRVLARSRLTPCRERVAHYGLPMRVLAADYSLDRNKLLFYFTAPQRVDFRELVRDLAALFKARIDLRQIGPRDEAKLIGGLAPCGKTQVCCTQFMRSFATITTRMAKIQRLPVQQDKLLGLCGQLKCCLKFEMETYQVLAKNLPRIGTFVLTKYGNGRVFNVEVLRQTLNVRLDDDRQIVCALDEISEVRGK